MTRKRIVPWWESLGVGGPAPADTAPDPADLGTAFGLDASFTTTVGELDAQDEPGGTGTADDLPRLRFSKRPPRDDAE